LNDLRKIIREIISEIQTSDRGSVDAFGAASSTQPKIPYNQRMNYYETLALQDDILKFEDIDKGFDWTGPVETRGMNVYAFDTFEKDEEKNHASRFIDVEFFKPEELDKTNIFELKFATAGKENALIANKESLGKVLPTISSIINDFVKERQPDAVVFRPEFEKGASHNDLTNVFIEYIKSHAPTDFISKEEKGVVKLIRRNFTSSFEELKKLTNPEPSSTGRVNPNFNGN